VIFVEIADFLDDLEASSKATTHSILPLLINVVLRVMRAELQSFVNLAMLRRE